MNLSRNYFKLFYMTISLVFLFQISGHTFIASASNGNDYSTIGGIEITDKKESEIQGVLAEAIGNWKQQPIVIEGTSGSITVSTDLIRFKVKETVDTYIKSQKTPWYQFWAKPKVVHLPLETELSDDIDNVLREAPYFFIDETKDLIQAQANYLGTSPIVPEEMTVTKDFMERIAFEIQPITHNPSVFTSLIEGLDEKLLTQNEVFSFLESIEALGETRNQEALDFFVSVLYSTVLQTEAKVLERHSQLEIPTYLQAGIEATVNKETNKDFSFQNKSGSPLLFSASIKDDYLLIEAHGLKNAKTARYSTNEKIVKPRTIYRLSSVVGSGQEKVENEGTNGYQVTVYRTILDEVSGYEIDEEVSKDFYPPTHKVVLVSAESEKVTEEPNDNNGQNNNSDTNQGEDGGDDERDVPTDPPNMNDGTSNDEDSEEVIYDKGGNIIGGSNS